MAAVFIESMKDNNINKCKNMKNKYYLKKKKNNNNKQKKTKE